MHTTPPRRTGAGRTPSTTPGRVDIVTIVIALALVSLLVVAGNGRAPSTDAAPPPTGGSSHGAAGSGRNGFGGEIAPSPTMRSWPGTGPAGNGGPFAFIGAHHGPIWQVPASANNSRGVGYCVMEDVVGEGTVSLQPDPSAWDAGEMARAGALMSTFGGDRVVPYGIDASGSYDGATGEWHQPALFGGGEYTRRRHVAVNFGVKMLLEDVSPSGAVAGLKLARDTAVVNGSGGEFSALRSGYVVAQYMAHIADAQHAVGGVRLQMVWATPDGQAPAGPGTYALEVRATDSTAKPVGHVPVVVLSDVGIGGARTVGAVAHVDRSDDGADATARWNAAAALGWPTMDMAGSLAADARFGLAGNPNGADVTDAAGIARFDVTITSTTWELAFHTQAPTADVSLYSGTGIQGQVTWSGPPQSYSTHVAIAPPPPPPVPPPPPPPQPPVPPPPTVPPPTVPEHGAFRVRKVLDAPDVQGARDMSGFEFEVRGAQGDVVARLVTGADGLTPPVDAAPGAYTIAEVARPTWADSLIDQGPIAYELAPVDGTEPHQVDYVNVVPDATIATSVRDAHDGDRLVDLDTGDATIVDGVAYSGLVPGTEYVATGELMVRAPEPTDTEGDVAPTVIPTGITASTAFVPDQSDGGVEVTFAVPTDSPLRGHAVVVYQRITVASSGRVVARHTDPDDAEQTIRFADVTPTTSSPTTSPPTTSPPATTIAAPATTASPTTTIAAPATTASPTTTIAAAATTASPTTTIAAAAPATSTSPPPSSTAATTPQRPALPRTGNSGVQATALVGITLVVLGLALLATVSVRRPPRSRAEPT